MVHEPLLPSVLRGGGVSDRGALSRHASEVQEVYWSVRHREIFSLSVRLHGEAAEESTILMDTTVQEKVITYPTDGKLAKSQGIRQRRKYVKEVKSLRLACRHFRYVRRRRKAVKRLRTIAGMLMRELERKLPEAPLPVPHKSFALYRRVLSQQPKDKDKIYSQHEPDIYCVGKEKGHQPWEYGRKASMVSTEDSQVIVGVVSHDENVYDSRTLGDAFRKPIVIAGGPAVTTG